MSSNNTNTVTNNTNTIKAALKATGFKSDGQAYWQKGATLVAIDECMHTNSGEIRAFVCDSDGVPCASVGANDLKEVINRPARWIQRHGRAAGYDVIAM